MKDEGRDGAAVSAAAVGGRAASLIGALETVGRVAALGRPLHLVGGWVFFGLGALLARAAGEPTRWPDSLVGLLAVSAAQLMTHYSNDYFDLDADSANSTPTRWSGGSRVLPGGRVAPRVALALALALGLISAGAALWLAAAGAPGSALLVGAGLALAWSYSAPPLALNRRALGEVSGALVVPGLTTLLGYHVQTGAPGGPPILAALPLCCFQFAMLLAVNFPDAAGDAAVGKETLVVRLGGARAAQLYITAVLAPYPLLPLLVAGGLPAAAGWALLPGAPLAAWLAWRMGRGAWRDPAAWDGLGFWSIGLLVGSGLLLIGGLLWGAA